MELSGLIFVALALVWAVVLLPKALRHHDELAETRSVDGVSDSMRVLARREVVNEKEARLVVGPAPAPASPRPAGSAEATPVVRTPVTTERVRARIAAQRKAAAAAARRRRHILVALLLAFAGMGIAAGLGHLPLWVVGVPAGLAVGFLVVARLTVRREHARWEVEIVRLKVAASTSPSTSTSTSTSPASAAARLSAESGAREGESESVPAPVPAHDERGFAVVSGLDDTSAFPVGLLDDVVPTTDAGSLWDPLPVTLPTYVTKPRANRSVRTIDLSAPGVASSGHDPASSALVADAATSAPPDDLPQRAVGS